MSFFKMRLRTSDRLFRQYALKVYGYTCARCGRVYKPTDCRGLHVSHYWSRAHENTRHDIENVCLLCFGCHQLWGHGEERDGYKEFMVSRLGQGKYDLLSARAHFIIKKRDDKADVAILKELLEGKE